MKTKQEVFNTVYLHLMNQQEKAMDEDMCKYRTERGLKCAAGVLIKDKYYKKTLEGYSVTTPAAIHALEKSGVGEESLSMVVSLQGVHDHEFVEGWKNELENVAKHHELEVPQL